MKKVVFVFIFLFLFPILSFATILQYVSLSDMTIESDTVVIGKVVEQKVIERNSTLYTISSIEITKSIKGNLSKSSVIKIRQRGGVKDGLKMVVLGDANLKLGKSYVLFLVKYKEFWILDAMAQSVYTIFNSDGKLMVKNDVSVPRIDTSTGKTTDGKLLSKPLPLDDFIKQIEQILESHRKAK